MKRVGKEGAVFEQDNVQAESTPVLKYEEIMSSPVSASVVDREKVIQEKFTQIEAKSVDDRIRALIRAVAMNRLEMEFSEISHLIFGSQLKLLGALTSASRPLPVSDAANMYIEAAAKFPEMHRDRTFDEWLGYLKANGLVHVSDNQIDITQYGSDFLKYLVDKRRTYDRAG